MPVLAGTATIYSRVSGASLLEIAWKVLQIREHPHTTLKFCCDSGDMPFPFHRVIGASGKKVGHILEAMTPRTLHTLPCEIDGSTLMFTKAATNGCIVAR